MSNEKTSGEIARLVASGRMSPALLFHPAAPGAPRRQTMRANAAAGTTTYGLYDVDLGLGESDSEEKLLLEQHRKCLASCAPRYRVTTHSIEETDPRCFCCCPRTNHYKLTHVTDLRHDECCGWCCSTLSVQLDAKATNGRESLDISCTDTASFFEVLRPRIGRVRFQNQ